MSGAEFERFWTLMGELFPAAARRKSENQKKIWRKGLEPFALGDAADAAIAYARRKNYFPDLAEITGKLRPEEGWERRAGAESPAAHNARLLALITGERAPDGGYLAWARRLRERGKEEGT